LIKNKTHIPFSSLPPSGEGSGMGALFRTFLPSLLWMIFILIVCLLPKKDIETIDFSWLPQNADKIVHAGFYIVLAILLSLSIIKYKTSLLKLVSVTFFICVLYGFLIEVLQHFFTTTRHFELMDVAANSAGAVVGLVLVFFRLKSKNNIMKNLLAVLVIIMIIAGCKNNNEGGLSLSDIDTTINGKALTISPTLIESYTSGPDEYKIFANYTRIVAESSDTIKCFESLFIYKNNTRLAKLFQTNLTDLFRSDNIRLASTREVKLIEIENMKNKTYCADFQQNMSTPGYNRYAFFNIGDTSVSSTDSIFGIDNQWFKSEKVVAENNCFKIAMYNSLFGFSIPVTLEEKENKLNLVLNIPESKIDSNYVMFDVNLDGGDYSKSVDSISIYPDNKSSEDSIKITSVRNLKNVRFLKAARLYDKMIPHNIYNFLSETREGTAGSTEDYWSKIKNYNTKWFLYIESDSIKGWVRKIQDYNKLGFMQSQ
jgi:hypothetical protein